MELPGDGIEHGDLEPGLLEPLLGLGAIVLVVAVLLAVVFLLRHRGTLPWPTTLPQLWPARQPPPEEAAKQILAERLARGDLSPEDFLERASMLNWTPGPVADPRRPGR